MNDSKIWYLYYRCRYCGELTKSYSVPDELLPDVRLEVLGIIPVTHGMHDKTHHLCNDITWGMADFECFSTDPNLATD